MSQAADMKLSIAFLYYLCYDLDKIGQIMSAE